MDLLQVPIIDKYIKYYTIVFPIMVADMGQKEPGKMMTCENGERVLSKYRCLFEFDKYSMQKGCSDMTHLQDCGMIQFYSSE